MLQAFLRHHPNITVLDYGPAAISPGLVDIHVHLNEPGREEWEGAWAWWAGEEGGGRLPGLAALTGGRGRRRAC